MKKELIRDPEYKAYIEHLPCYLCGHIPKGTVSRYNEYKDDFEKKPCKNNAHHVDNTRTRADNDHRILPLCGHYTVSGGGTKNCHEKVHGNKEYKSTEAIEQFNVDADEYYELYITKLFERGIK